MPAIADLDTYKGMLIGGQQQVPIIKTGTGASGRLSSAWTQLPINDVAPTSAVALSNSSTGALPLEITASRRLIGAHLSASRRSTVILIDRLSHQGNISAAAAGTLTTNLPTAALTRYTSGEGVFIGIEIYSQIGATATTITVTYTNQAGTGSRVTPLQPFGGTGYREALRFLQVPFQAGDTGVQSVQSVTIGGAGTGTAGAFGIVLYRPIAAFHVDSDCRDRYFNMIDGGMSGNLPAIEASACLSMLVMSVASTVTFSGALTLVES